MQVVRLLASGHLLQVGFLGAKEIDGLIFTLTFLRSDPVAQHEIALEPRLRKQVTGIIARKKVHVVHAGPPRLHVALLGHASVDVGRTTVKKRGVSVP